MIIIGTFIRGPGWQWFWPGQTWDHNRLIYEVNRDLPDLFGITSNWVKAIFRPMVVGGFYAIGGFSLHGFFRRNNPKDYKRMSLLQYSIMMFFVITMFALPIKMAAAAFVSYQVCVDYSMVQRVGSVSRLVM